ncbi:MAG: TIGR01906 family membrane protein [Candidatus Atribacteria bacterium]|nr:TIGR01906 family membrane protein [Candidatus Atribacteria bacterium]
MNILRTIPWLVFIISIPLLLISSTVFLEMNYLPFYEYAYQKYHISEVTEFSDEQLMGITRHLVQFFNDKIASPQLMLENQGKPMYLFHDYEIRHLQDVKMLFRYSFYVALVMLVYGVGYLLFTRMSGGKKRWNYFWRGVRNGNILTLVLLISLGIAIIVAFHNIFIKFHYLVFGDPQSSPWMLNPLTDYLVMIYPLSFWQDAIIFGIGVIAVVALLMSFISIIGVNRTAGRGRYWVG